MKNGPSLRSYARGGGALGRASSGPSLWLNSRTLTASVSTLICVLCFDKNPVNGRAVDCSGSKFRCSHFLDALNEPDAVLRIRCLGNSGRESLENRIHVPRVPRAALPESKAGT